MSGMPGYTNFSLNDTTAAPVDQSALQNIGSPESQTSDAIGNALKYGLPGLAAGLVDTVGTSLGLLKDSSVSNYLQNAFGPNGFGDWYSRNRDAVRTGSDIVGMFIPGTLAVKALKSARYAREAGAFGDFLKDSKTADVLLGSSTRMSELENNMQIAGNDAGMVAGSITGRTLNTDAVLSSKRAYYLANIGDSLRESAVFEAATYPMFNNSVLFPQDQSAADYALWSAGGSAVAAGASFLVSKFAATRLVRTAFTAGMKSMEAERPLAGDLATAMYRPNNRGAGIGINAASYNDEQHIFEEANTIMRTPLNASIARTNAATSQNVLESTLQKQINSVASDPNLYAKNVPLSPDQYSVVRNALKQNPMLYVGVTNTSAVPANASKFLSRYAETHNQILEAAQDEAATAADVAKAADSEREFMVLDAAGNVNPLVNRPARWLDQNSFSDIATHRTTIPLEAGAGKNEQVNRYEIQSASGSPVSIDEAFHITAPKVPTPEDIDAVQAIGSYLISKLKPGSIATAYTLSPQRNWRELDLALTAANTHPEIIPRFIYAGGFTNLDDVIQHVTDQRYQEFTKLTGTQAGSSAPSVFGKRRLSMPEIVNMCNMPTGMVDQQAPMTSLFTDLAQSHTNSLYDIFAGATGNYAENLQAAMRESAGITDLANKPAVSGGMFAQKDVRPILLHMRNLPFLTRSDTYLQAASDAIRSDVMSRATQVTADQSPIINGVIQALAGNAATDVSRQVQNLREGDLHGHGTVVYQDRAIQDNPTLKAMALQAQTTDSVIQATTQAALDPLTTYTAAFHTADHAADAVDLARIEHSYRHGFVVRGVSFPDQGGGKVANFILDKDDPRNEVALATYFGKDAVFPRDADGNWLMPDMALSMRSGVNNTPKPLVVSDMAGAAAQQYSDLFTDFGRQQNILRGLTGLPVVQLREFHMPPPGLDKDTAFFVQNAKQKTVNIYSRGTAAENQRQAQQAAATLTDATGENHVAISADQWQAQALADGNYYDVVDYNDFLRKNASMKGGLIESQIEASPATWDSLVKNLTNQYLALGTRTRALIFEPELQYAKLAAMTSPKGAGGLMNENNIFTRYINTAFSRSSRNPQGIVARAYKGLESALDVGLNAAQKVWIGAQQTLGVDSMLGKTEQNLYQQYQKSAAAWSPFKTADDWVTSTYHVQKPWTSKAAVSRLSQVSNALILRMLNLGTPVLNYLGTASVLPAVVQSFRQHVGEADSDYLSRVAAYGTNFDGKTFTFSPMKALAQASRQLFDGSMTDVLRDAAAKGYTKPEYTQLNEILTNENLGKKGAIDRFIDATSYLADHSEEQCRRLVWGVGYNLAKDVFKVEDPRNRYLFAQHMVNETIGNYSPMNKPSIFQGTLGIPLGAFQTYMYNYYRRLFSYIENKDIRSLAVNAAGQASLFGIAGLPGWNSFNQFFGSSKMGDSNITNKLQTNLSPTASELLLHGTISSIPRIFGADGIALYSRGSTDLTKQINSPSDLLHIMPTPFTYADQGDTGNLPLVQFLNNTGHILQESVANALQGFSLEQEEQILAHYSTNRLFRGVMEMAAGTSTDRANQLISADTRSAIKLAATIFGSTPTAEREMQDAYYQQKTVEYNQAALRATLNAKARSMFRSGNVQLSALQDMTQDYIASGGNPKYFGSWLRANALVATQTKGDTKLRQLLNSGKGVEYQNMLAAMQASPDSSDEEPVPGGTSL
jgi:hypothetical protein